MDGESCLRQAYDAILQGDFEMAVHWFGEAIALEPDNASYHYRGSITCARSGKYTLAYSYALRAVELNPEDPVYRLHLEMLTARERTVVVRSILTSSSPDLEQCEALLKDAVSLDPLSAEAWVLLGIVYRMERNYRQSLYALREALNLDPQFGEARRLLHDVREEQRRHYKYLYTQYKPRRNR